MKYYTLTEEGRIKWLELRLGGITGLTLNEEDLLLEVEWWGVFTFRPGVFARWVDRAILSLERKGLIKEVDEDS